MFTRWDVQQTFIDNMCQNGLMVRNALIWHKGCGGMGDLKRTFAQDYETILFAPAPEFQFQGKRPFSSVLPFKPRANNLIVHPNEKPVSVLEYLIEKTCPEGGVVLDCCMGSGTTGLAAVKKNRDFIGIELDDHWYAVASERIRKAQEGTARNV